MKKIILFLIVLVFFINTSINSQNKPKKIHKYYISCAQSDNCNIEPEINTGLHFLVGPPTMLFGKYKIEVGISYIKTGDEYYLFLMLILPHGKKFQIQRDNPFVMIFDDNKNLAVFPCGDFKGRKKFAIGSFYPISQDQLQQIANSTIKSIRIYITNEAGHPLSSSDEDGKIYIGSYIERGYHLWNMCASNILNM